MAVQGGLPSYSEKAMLRQLAFLADISEADMPSFPQILTAKLTGLRPGAPPPDFSRFAIAGHFKDD